MSDVEGSSPEIHRSLRRGGMGLAGICDPVQQVPSGAQGLVHGVGSGVDGRVSRIRVSWHTDEDHLRRATEQVLHNSRQPSTRKASPVDDGNTHRRHLRDLLFGPEHKNRFEADRNVDAAITTS